MNPIFYAPTNNIESGLGLLASGTYRITEEKKLQQEKIKIALNEGKVTKFKNTVKPTTILPGDFLGSM